MKKRVFLSTVLILLLVLSINAQKKLVHGKIVAFNKFPLEHAEISNKKSKVTTITDSLGFFSIESKVKDKLTFKAGGFKSVTYKVKNHTDSIHVNLIFGGGEKDIEIATGYGHIKKRNLTYAITHLEAENNDNVNYTDIVEMIKVKVPGMTMMGDEFIIRGVTSISNSNGALIVVNGMATNINTLRSMSVLDVKTINVLKGPAAAIYGSRGANGVIVVTLKN